MGPHLRFSRRLRKAKVWPHRRKQKARPCGRAACRRFGGAERDRTDDLLSAIQALSQLSYSPTFWEVPLLTAGLESTFQPLGRADYRGENSQGQTPVRRRLSSALASSACMFTIDWATSASPRRR